MFHETVNVSASTECSGVAIGKAEDMPSGKSGGIAVSGDYFGQNLINVSKSDFKRTCRGPCVHVCPWRGLRPVNTEARRVFEVGLRAVFVH